MVSENVTYWKVFFGDRPNVWGFFGRSRRLGHHLVQKNFRFNHLLTSKSMMHTIHFCWPSFESKQWVETPRFGTRKKILEMLLSRVSWIWFCFRNVERKRSNQISMLFAANRNYNRNCCLKQFNGNNPSSSWNLVFAYCSRFKCELLYFRDVIYLFFAPSTLRDLFSLEV